MEERFLLGHSGIPAQLFPCFASEKGALTSRVIRINILCRVIGPGKCDPASSPESISIVVVLKHHGDICRKLFGGTLLVRVKIRLRYLFLDLLYQLFGLIRLNSDIAAIHAAAYHKPQ